MVADCYQATTDDSMGLINFILLLLNYSSYLCSSQNELALFSHSSIRSINKLISDKRYKREMSHSMQIQLFTATFVTFVDFSVHFFLKSVEEEKLFKGLSLLGINSLCNSEDFMIYSLFRYYLDFFCLSYL